MKGGMQKLEMNFSTLVDQLCEKLPDLSLSSEELQPVWNKLLQVRTQMASLHGLDWAAKGGAARGYAMGGDVGESTVEDWKSKLSPAYSKEMKLAATKEVLQYHFDTAASGNGFEAAVLCSWSENTYQGEERPSRKQAEHAAAKVALKAEFPRAFAEAQASFSGTKGKGNGKAVKGNGKGVPPVAGNKRKHDAVESSSDSKNLFYTKMSIVKAELGLGPLAAGDIQLESTPQDDNMYTSAVSIPFLPGKKKYTGDLLDSKKAAEKSACEVALKALNGLIAKHEGSYQERKKLKNKESFEKMQAATKAKKEGFPL